MRREYKSRSIDLDRTAIDLEIMLKDFPISLIDGQATYQQVELFTKRIKKDIKKVHTLQLVYPDRWINITYGYFAGVHFLPWLVGEITTVPEGYTIKGDFVFSL